MFGWLIRRVAASVFTLVAVTLAGFGIVRLMPGDPAEAYLRASHHSASLEAAAALRTEMGLDQPLAGQYLRWLSAALQGDFGTSFTSKQAIAEEIASYFPNTLQLALSSFVTAMVLGLTLGTVSFLHQGRTLDRAGKLFASFGAAIPGFLLGYVLLYLFSYRLNWFPMLGKGSAAHDVLPSLTLSAIYIGSLSRLFRASLLEQADQPYVRYARIRGVFGARLFAGHLLKPAILPMVTAAGLCLGSMLSGSIIVENVFAWPGIGKYFVAAVANRDYPVIQMCVLLFAAVYAGIGLIVDLLYCGLNPVIRWDEGGKKDEA
ncbi:ABC transporter permease [Cohnella sp. REN36]|uniref:ABC transporter permease n=1 Tax=Cohnella sp. REN36 TaxID=2887347 RepID=UPI001D1330E6|nr:ABC transporter permease [Cohnella sp. REN36]MCC3373710.1 ABC transporter permease [Cohnella sp. REN36]